MAGTLAQIRMRLIPWFLSTLLCASAAPRAVWIDTDPSVAPGGHEIDDGIALLQAFHSPELAIRGVSIVFGNADLPTADRIGRYIVSHFGPAGLPVYTGAGSAAGIRRDTQATRALATALRRERLTILALGPATNIAALLKLHPELAPRIDEIVAVAGRRPGQRFTAGAPNGPSFRDLNFEMDPEAFQILLDANVKLTFAPWEVSSKVWLTRQDLEPLAPHNPGVAWLMPAALDWLKLWKTQFGAGGFNPFDALAVGYLLDPGDLACSTLKMRIERAPDDIAPGASAPEKPYLLVRESGDGREVKYCHTAASAFKDHLLQRLASNRR